MHTDTQGYTQLTEAICSYNMWIILTCHCSGISRACTAVYCSNGLKQWVEQQTLKPLPVRDGIPDGVIKAEFAFPDLLKQGGLTLIIEGGVAP